MNYFGMRKAVRDYRKLPAGKKDVLRRRRLYELVSFARENSPYYASLYANMPANFILTDIPTTNKEDLAKNWQNWPTDRQITSESIKEFLDNSTGPEDLYKGRLCVVTTSGSNDAPLRLIYTQSELKLMSAIARERMLPVTDTARSFSRTIGRLANVYTDSGHSFTNVFTHMRRRFVPFRKKSTLILQAQDSTNSLINRLTEFAPRILAGYPSVLGRLADAKKASRLKIKPEMILADGEEMTPEQRNRISSIFGAPVYTSYSAAEAGVIAYECQHHHLHINDDWCIVEPVNYDGQVVGYGKPADMLLITNLLNHTTPIIRYELDDKAVVYNAPCPCGCNSPWIELLGKSFDQVVMFKGPTPFLVPVSSFEKALESVEEIKKYQILVFPGNRIALRLSPSKGYDKTIAFFKAESRMRSFLRDLGIVGSAITLEKEDPHPDPYSGKYSTVITYYNHQD